MKNYIYSAIVIAESMNEKEFLKRYYNKDEGDTTKEGFVILHAHGYPSWSPKEKFLNDHKEITESELKLMNATLKD